MVKKIVWRVLLTIVILAAAIGLLIPVLQNVKLGLDLQGGFEILYQVKSIDKDEKVTNDMVNATYKTLVKRIDVLGVLEPTINIEGDKIRVQLAGIDNADDARNILSQTASLSFRDTNDNLLMTSDVLRSGAAKVGRDDSGSPVVSLSIKDKDEFYKVTKKVSQMSDNRIVIWLDFDEETDSFESEQAMCGSLNNSRCLSVASVSQGFSSDVIIQGNFEEEEVENLVDLINSGSMPTKLVEVSSKSVGASFGANSLEKTAVAGVVGIVLILIFLTLIYRFSGFMASVGIVVYTSLTFFIFWMIGGTLTLPGIAAMIIGVGMAVDSNIINFSRIKEEMYEGRGVQSAVKNGNKNSFTTILDANITTLITAVILFIFGQSSVKGFATMLIISIFVTFVIMVFFVRWLTKLFVKTGMFDKHPKAFINVKPKDIPNINNKEKRTKYFYKKVDFIKNRKIFMIIALIISVIGVLFIAKMGLNLGVDFKGGTVITLKTSENLTENKVSKDIDKLGYDMYNFEEQSDGSYAIKITESLGKTKAMAIEDYFADKYEASTDVAVISNVVKQELIRNAILSLVLAAMAVVLYISFRFKFSYGVSSIVALLINVLVTVSLFSIFRFEVSSIFIAAILSIIGYSVNDVIITFDRIRENVNKKKVFKTADELNDVVNNSLREILNRSIITNLTTLIPVLALIFLGSHDIYEFNIALLIGFITGTLSSLFVASQLWLEIEKKYIKTGKVKKNKKKDVFTDEIDELAIKGINS
ncbi:MAG: protein translocase subunit SecD [Bacilli bacterium]|nr:protein translocase subunit SecD [Bacilli bacterium]